jgi:hypothetical protein
MAGRVKSLRALVLAVLTLIPSERAHAQSPEERAAARRIVEKRQEAIVNVRAVLKMRMTASGREMQAREETVEAVATVLDGSGLAVMSLATLNPGGLLKKMMGMAASAGSAPFDVVTEPSDVRMRLGDSTELAAKIVLRDEDLDLAFIRPATAPAKPLASLAEVESGRPTLLDPVVVVARLGRVGGYGPAASLQQVQASVERPRIMYVVQPGGIGGMGVPAFSLDGKLAGFMVLRSVASGGFGMLGAMGGNVENLGLLPILVPAAEVREVAKQAEKP